MNQADSTTSPPPVVRLAPGDPRREPRTPRAPRTFGWRKAQSPWRARLAWTGLLVICASMLTAGWRLTPDPRGLGTHQQLGFMPCGFQLATGLPCPTCGATTAFAWMVHGHPWAALKVQPFGGVAAMAVAALLALSLAGIVTGSAPSVRLSRRAAFGVAVLVTVLFVGSWLYRLAGALPERWN